MVAAAVGGCGGATVTATTSGASPDAVVAAGKALFSDTSLSASGRQSCATCHVAARAFAGDPQVDDGLPVPLGGASMAQPGFRNAPSLMYVSFKPPFSLTDGPQGGFFRDGRASSLAAQAKRPFLTSFEMANADAAEVVARLQGSAATRQAFVAAFGEASLGDAQAALDLIGTAIAAYETEDEGFHPFTSKYDYWLSGRAQLTPRELNGLALFNNPAKGNCTSCHPSQRQGFSTHALFTDFTFDNLGVPRNWAVPANLSSTARGSFLPVDAEYAYYDMGLCGPFEPDADDGGARPGFSGITSLCGFFKVPTLRNIAITSPYFHNGVFATLHQVVEWYVTRDINNAGNNPFYTAADGSPDSFVYNDLPAAYDPNVNIGEIPYTPSLSAGGQSPTLTAADIDDVIAFLGTLTAGYDPSQPSVYVVPSQCAPTAQPSETVSP